MIQTYLPIALFHYTENIMEETEDEPRTFWELLQSLNFSFNIHPFSWKFTAGADEYNTYLAVGPFGFTLWYC